MSHRRQHNFYLRLLFDEELRDRFVANPTRTLEEEGLEGQEATPFTRIDARGLSHDAEIRTNYVMSTLCRPYVLSAGALGAQAGGPEQLRAFMASKAVFESAGKRAQEFGAHLAHILELNVNRVHPTAAALLGSLLALEAARVDNAARIRQAAVAGQTIDKVKKYSGGSAKHRPIRLPGYLLVCELPAPLGLVRSALNNIDASNAWHTIRAGALDFDRVLSVARSNPIPTTVISRGHLVSGQPPQSSGPLRPHAVVEVSHQVIELSGRQSTILASVDGKTPLAKQPRSAQPLLRILLEQGFLELVKRP